MNEFFGMEEILSTLSTKASFMMECNIYIVHKLKTLLHAGYALQ